MLPSLPSAAQAPTSAPRDGDNAAVSAGMVRRAAGPAHSASSATSGTLSASPMNTREVIDRKVLEEVVWLALTKSTHPSRLVCSPVRNEGFHIS